MKALPAEDEIDELPRLAGDDLLAQQTEAAALHLVEVARGGVLVRLALAPRDAHRSPRSHPFLQLSLRPRALERVAGQDVSQADQRVRVEETRQDDRRVC